MPIGSVKVFSLDSFVHIGAIARAGLATLTLGQLVNQPLAVDRCGQPAAVHPAAV